MEVDSEEIAEYIKSILHAVQQGVSDSSGFYMSGTVKIRIGVRNQGEKDGGIRVAVVGVGAKRAKEENASIEFEVINPFNVVLKETWEELLQQFKQWQKSRPTGVNSPTAPPSS